MKHEEMPAVLAELRRLRNVAPVVPDQPTSESNDELFKWLGVEGIKGLPAALEAARVWNSVPALKREKFTRSVRFLEGLMPANDPALVKTVKYHLDVLIEITEPLFASPEAPKDSTHMDTSLLIFISHSSKDPELAKRLVKLLVAALGVEKSAIRCTSVSGCTLQGGDHQATQLLHDIKTAPCFLALITDSSVESAYCLFELGARWAVGGSRVPIMGPNASPSMIPGPLGEVHGLKTSVRTEMQQLLEEVSQKLRVSLRRSSSYDEELSDLVGFSPPSSAQPKGTKPDPNPSPVLIPASRPPPGGRGII